MNSIKRSITWNNRLCFLILPLILIACACHPLKTSLKTDIDDVHGLLRIVIRASEEARVLARLSEMGLQPVKLRQLPVTDETDQDIICLLLEFNWRNRVQFLAYRPQFPDDNLKIIAYQIEE